MVIEESISINCSCWSINPQNYVRQHSLTFVVMWNEIIQYRDITASNVHILPCDVLFSAFMVQFFLCENR